MGRELYFQNALLGSTKSYIFVLLVCILVFVFHNNVTASNAINKTNIEDLVPVATSQTTPLNVPIDSQMTYLQWL